MSCQQKAYASEVGEHLGSLGLFVDIDNSDNTLSKKIRNGEIAQYNFILGAFFFYIDPKRESADSGDWTLGSRWSRRVRRALGKCPKPRRCRFEDSGRSVNSAERDRATVRGSEAR
jgi:hypothetical protein